MGKKVNGQFTVRLNRGYWVIYRIVNVRDDYNFGLQKVDSEPEFPLEKRQEAIKRMYTLNGWRYDSTETQS